MVFGITRVLRFEIGGAGKYDVMCGCHDYVCGNVSWLRHISKRACSI